MSLQVSIQWMSSESYKKPPNAVKKCVVSAVPPPASPVLNVSLSDLTVSEDEIRFVFNWSPPAATNGRLTHYLACLGGRRLSHFEQNPDAPDGNDTVCVEIKSVSHQTRWRISHHCYGMFHPSVLCVCVCRMQLLLFGSRGNLVQTVSIFRCAVSNIIISQQYDLHCFSAVHIHFKSTCAYRTHSTFFFTPFELSQL